MKTPTLFREYIWLVNTIYRAGKISLADINTRWMRTDMSDGLPLSRTTFNRHKDAIEDIFGIYIDCDRRDGYRYYIGNEEVLREDTVQNWMLSTLTVNNLVSESMSLQHRIMLENIPSDGGISRNGDSSHAGEPTNLCEVSALPVSGSKDVHALTLLHQTVPPALVSVGKV